MANKEVQKTTQAVEPTTSTAINWKVRAKNKAFWLALIPAILVLIQVVAAVFGYTTTVSWISGREPENMEAMLLRWERPMRLWHVRNPSRELT